MHQSDALSWRDVVEKHHCALVDELSERLDSELRQAVSEAMALEHSKFDARLKQAGTDARRTQIDSLNQFLRRLRGADQEQVLALLAEDCSPYAEQLVVLVFESNQFESNQARSVAFHGLSFGASARTGFDGAREFDTNVVSDFSLVFDTSQAPAIIAAIETRDPMVALGTATEISPVLAEAFGSVFQRSADQKAYLFPVQTRHSVVAMLIAAGVEVSAPIELLCEAAGMRLEAAGIRSSGAPGPNPKSAGSIELAQEVPASETSAPRAWGELSLEDQKLHLQAQRIARVRVAEMRLYHENELRSGVAGSDIYGALQNEINSARDQFLQTFLSKSPTMVDYLHLEILRSLAHDDDRLLGNNYPGPMV